MSFTKALVASWPDLGRHGIPVMSTVVLQVEYPPSRWANPNFYYNSALASLPPPASLRETLRVTTWAELGEALRARLGVRFLSSCDTSSDGRRR